jgi:hypothetical protein
LIPPALQTDGGSKHGSTCTMLKISSAANAAAASSSDFANAILIRPKR